MPSGIILVESTAASIPTPQVSRVTLFVDSSTGEPSYKDDAGTTTSLRGADGAAGGVTSPVTGISSSAGVLNIDCSLGNYFTTTLTENITSITFSNLPASGEAETIMLRITQHASAPKTVAWPAAFKWAGSAGSVSSTNSAVDVLAITTFDQGTRWEATLSKAFA